MPSVLNPYINFRDNARQALEFYNLRSKMMAEKAPSLVPSIVQYADAS